MATPSPPPGFSPTAFPTPPAPSPSNSSSNGPPTSLYLYTFVVTLSLLFVIFGTLVVRSVRLRRQRNAAIAAGTYVPATALRAALRGKGDGPLAPKPLLWEAHVVPVDDAEKGWGGIFPVAGTTLVSVTEGPAKPSLTSQQRTSWRSQLPIPFLGSRRSMRPDPPSTPPTTPSLEPPTPPPPPSEPIHLSVLISMPMPPAYGKAENGNGGPPVVEFGIAQVGYAPGATSL